MIDEGLTLEMSAFLPFTVASQFMFSTQLLILNYLLYSLTDAAPVSLETYPFINFGFILVTDLMM